MKSPTSRTTFTQWIEAYPWNEMAVPAVTASMISVAFTGSSRKLMPVLVWTVLKHLAAYSGNLDDDAEFSRRRFRLARQKR